MSIVLVTGANGKTGSALLDLLRRREGPVRAASRTPETAATVRLDWDDATTYGPALEGVDRIYLVPPPATVDPLPAVAPFLAEARRRGIRRVVMLGSAIEFPHAPGMLELAARVRAQPGWLVLRASGFMQNFLRPHPLGATIRDHGEIATSAECGRVGWIDVRDIAATAAATLTDPLLDEDLEDDYVLTGPRGLSYTDAATIISAQTGRAVHIRDLTVDALAARFRSSGMSAAFAAGLAAVEDDIRAGRYGRVTTSVLDLTGSPPHTFEDFVREHADEWRPADGPRVHGDRRDRHRDESRRS